MTASLKAVPNLEPEFDGRLYHVTSVEKGRQLLEQGFGPEQSYWSLGTPITDYYAELVEDEGGVPVVISVALEDLDEALILPDMPSIAEPLTHTLQTTEELVIGAWEKGTGTWRDSLNLVGSIAYNGPIPADLLGADH